MQTIRLRSQVGGDGQIQVQLPSQLANQQIDIVLVYQPVAVQEKVELSSHQPQDPHRANFPLIRGQNPSHVLTDEIVAEASFCSD